MKKSYLTPSVYVFQLDNVNTSVVFASGGTPTTDPGFEDGYDIWNWEV